MSGKFFSKKIEKIYNSHAYTTIINHKKTGIFHLGSSDLISHYDFIKTLLIRRHKKIGILKQVFTSNTIRYLATLPKENKLPNHIIPSYTDVLDDLSIC